MLPPTPHWVYTVSALIKSDSSLFACSWHARLCIAERMSMALLLGIITVPPLNGRDRLSNTNILLITDELGCFPLQSCCRTEGLRRDENCQQFNQTLRNLIILQLNSFDGAECYHIVRRNNSRTLNRASPSSTILSRQLL